MGTDAKRKADRDARLDKLVTLTKQWSTSVQKEYNSRAQQLQTMVNSRCAGSVAQTSVGVASELVVDEIDSFLSG